MKLARRDFLIASSASLALLTTHRSLFAVTSPRSNALHPRKVGPSAPAQGVWVPSTCQGCTQWCAVQVFVQDGRATRVSGNPGSKTNHGYVCPRGHMIPQQAYDPDRIKVPMQRTNPLKGRGVDPKFVPISWDEALDIVADKMIALRNAGQPEKLVYMRGRYSSTSNHLLYGTLPKVFGTPNYFSHSAICAEAEKMGPGLTQGFFGYRDYDLENTDCVVFWGTDPLASNRMVPNVIHRFHEIAARGTVVAVDPRLSNVAAKAHEWLPLKPGSDGALASAIAHVLLTEGLWNKEFVGDFKDGKNLFKKGKIVDEALFVERETYGLVRWWNLELKDKSPAWAERETLIPAGQILRVARAMGKAAPKTVVWMGPGAAMHPRGTYSSMAVHALNGILGSIDVEGGVWQASAAPALNKFPSSDSYIDALARNAVKGKKLDGRGDKDMPAMMNAKPGSGVVTNNVANAILKDPSAVQVLISSWSNFNFSCTGANRWDEAMSKVPFFVHMVTNASEMTQFADIVLPSTMNTLEGWSIITNMGNGYGYASIQQPVIKRMWDVKQEETEVVWLLAEKLKAKGFPNLFDYYSKEFKDPETGKSPTTALEFSEIATKMTSAPLWRSVSADKPAAIKGWSEFRRVGIAVSGKYPLKKNWGKFNTVTKKFEFYSETLKKGLLEHAAKHKSSSDEIMEVCGYQARGDLAFVPHYESPKRHGSVKDYPFAFIDYKSRLNREGRSANLPWYQEFKKLDPGDVSWGDVLKMHPKDAKRLGLKDGDNVKISSPAGAITTQLRLWEGVRPGTVTKCFGQGHWAYGATAAADYAKAKPRGGNNNEILVDDYDRLSGATARNGGFTGVRVERV